MATPQQNNEAFEVKLNRTNLAIIQAVLTSTNAPLDIDWQKAMEKVEVTRADNAQRQFKDALRKLGLAYPKVGGEISIAEESKQLVPKKRAAVKNRSSAPKKAKNNINQDEEDKVEGDFEGKERVIDTET